MSSSLSHTKALLESVYREQLVTSTTALEQLLSLSTGKRTRDDKEIVATITSTTNESFDVVFDLEYAAQLEFALGVDYDAYTLRRSGTDATIGQIYLRIEDPSDDRTSRLYVRKVKIFDEMQNKGLCTQFLIETMRYSIKRVGGRTPKYGRTEIQSKNPIAAYKCFTKAFKTIGYKLERAEPSLNPITNKHFKTRWNDQTEWRQTLLFERLA